MSQGNNNITLPYSMWDTNVINLSCGRSRLEVCRSKHRTNLKTVVREWEGGGTKYLSITKEFTPIDDIKDVKKVEDGHTTIQDARVI